MKYGSVETLSAQQILDCSTGDCSGGNPRLSLPYVQTHGVGNQKSYGYTGVKGSCRTRNQTDKYKIQFWNEEFPPINRFGPKGKNSDMYIRNATTNNGPVLTGLVVTAWRNYRGGILRASQCPKDDLLWHFAQIVGWDTGSNPPYWIMRNSWGPNWGESGYIKMEMGQDACKMISGGTSFYAVAA